MNAQDSYRILLGATLVNEGVEQEGTVILRGRQIAAVLPGVTTLAGVPAQYSQSAHEVMPCHGLLLLPGAIDDQVHFREPGLTHKATIASESKAAVAGGVTSFMDMPNTNPPTTTAQALIDKRQRASETSWANYAFFVGGTNTNYSEVMSIPPGLTPGIKLFLGASTGNMLVDCEEALESFFAQRRYIVAVHAEDEEEIARNKAHFLSLHRQEELDIHYHSQIRSNRACYLASLRAVERARRLGTRLHLLHLSTAEEMSLLAGADSALPLTHKKITAEVCVHHLWFTDEDYNTKGNLLKWNPAIKGKADREALRRALLSGAIDLVATDHAPHLLSEKEGDCLTAASGGPSVQYSLLAMLELAKESGWSRAVVVQKMAHNPAILFSIAKRGFIRPGYFADLVLVDPHTPTTVSREGVLSLCGWSPFEGTTFSHSIHSTFVNGTLAYHQGALQAQRPPVEPLEFNAHLDC